MILPEALIDHWVWTGTVLSVGNRKMNGMIELPKKEKLQWLAFDLVFHAATIIISTLVTKDKYFRRKLRHSLLFEPQWTQWNWYRPCNDYCWSIMDFLYLLHFSCRQCDMRNNWIMVITLKNCPKVGFWRRVNQWVTWVLNVPLLCNLKLNIGHLCKKSTKALVLN